MKCRLVTRLEASPSAKEPPGTWYEVGHVIDNPKDGYKALESGKYELLLLDIMMGRGAEGVMLARKVRKDPKFGHLPVLVMTSIREQMAFLFPGQPLDPRFVPGEALLEKPVEPQLLLDKVGALLRLADAKKLQAD